VKQVPAIIESAIDITQIAAEVRKAHIALRDAEAAEQRAEAEHEKASENAARRRFELGQGLIKARKAWPARRSTRRIWTISPRLSVARRPSQLLLLCQSTKRPQSRRSPTGYAPLSA
jgi:hypothetical protein